MLSQKKPVAKAISSINRAPSFFVVLLGEYVLFGRHVFKESLRLPHDADVEAVLDKDVVNTQPARDLLPSRS